METPLGSQEPPKASNNVTTFGIGIIMMGSKTRNTKARIGTMALGSVAIGVGMSINHVFGQHKATERLTCI